MLKLAAVSPTNEENYRHSQQQNLYWKYEAEKAYFLEDNCLTERYVPLQKSPLPLFLQSINKRSNTVSNGETKRNHLTI